MQIIRCLVRGTSGVFLVVRQEYPHSNHRGVTLNCGSHGIVSPAIFSMRKVEKGFRRGEVFPWFFLGFSRKVWSYFGSWLRGSGCENHIPFTAGVILCYRIPYQREKKAIAGSVSRKGFPSLLWYLGIKLAVGGTTWHGLEKLLLF